MSNVDHTGAYESLLVESAFLLLVAVGEQCSAYQVETQQTDCCVGKDEAVYQ